MIESIIEMSNKLKNEARQKDIINYSHYIDVLLLFTTVNLPPIQYVSLMSCLIRPDYNFAIAFFAYFLKQ